MHGLGNDFIVMDRRRGELQNIPELARRVCRRRFGVGADQLLLIYDSSAADFTMRIFNADGGEVEMCGNGIRCFAKYIWDRGLSEKDELSVETHAGIIKPEKSGDMVKVDMGEPILEGRLIPVRIEGMIKDFPLKIDDKMFKITCVSMGNPHAVIVADDVDVVDVVKYGPLIENHELFPNRINVEFIQVIDSGNIKMRVWERGAGETMACGTGAAASVVASNIKGLTGKKVNVMLQGGQLLIEWSPENHIYMTGPAVEVYSGEVDIQKWGWDK